MRFFSKSSLLIGLLSAVSFVSFAGLVSGTVAWYANTTHVTIEYSGTSVSSSQQLQIGLYFKDPTYSFTDEECTSFELTKQAIDGTVYYWTEPGSGLSDDLVTSYLGRQGYATTELEPTTTRAYAPGDVFSLYHCPTAFDAVLDKAALKSTYCVLSLAFRVLRPVAEGVSYLPNKEIWVSNATAESTADGHKIDQALRLHFDNGEAGHQFIVAPSAPVEDLEHHAITEGETKVAGLLNLNNDGYYDCNADDEEIIYGDYDGDSFTVTDSFTALQAASLDDVNETGLRTDVDANASTFLSKHREGTSGYLSGTFAGELNAKTAKYYTLAGIAPNDDGYGNLDGGVYVAKTASFTGEANAYKAVANVDMTVYIEGWDHAVIDTEISFGFNLGLTFQINRV